MMKWHGYLSLASTGLLTLGIVALAATTPQTVFAASETSSEAAVVKGANAAESRESDSDKEDAPLIKRGKSEPKPKQVGRQKDAPNPGIRAARRQAKIQLILQGQKRLAKSIVTARTALAGEKKQAASARPGDDDAGNANKDTGLVERPKREPKPMQNGRENVRDPKIKAKKRKAKLKLLAKTRDQIGR